MRFPMPITKRIVKNHFHYSLWKYALLAVIALTGWNLIYTSTRYQSPENLKIEFYAETGSLGTKDLQTLCDQIRAEVMPEMEEVSANSVTYDQTYGDMQLIVWVSAAQGDVYLIAKDRFASLASNEALMDLQPFVDSGALNVAGLDLKKGIVKNADTGVSALLGIPADALPGLGDYGLVTSDAVLCVLTNNGNDDYSILFLNYLLTHMRTSEDSAATVAPTATATPTATAKPTVTATPTATAAPTATATPSATAKPTATATPTATAKPTATATVTVKP